MPDRLRTQRGRVSMCGAIVAALLGTATISAMSARAANPVLPHVYRSGVNLAPYGGTVSRAVTYWKGVVYVSVDAETCWTGQADSPYTLYAVNVSDPDHLSYLSRAAPGGCKANGLVVHEDRLFVAHWFGFLSIWDVATPGVFNFLGEYVVPAQATWSIGTADDRVYLGMAIETLQSFYIVDVSDPARPTEVSHADWMGGPAVRGSYSYYADGPWFKVLNISDEREPWEMSAVHAGGNLGEIRLSGRYAFAVLGWSPDPQTGMIIYDLADPAHPVEVGRWVAHDSYGFRGICLLGDLAFLPTSGNGFFTVNVADPNHPVTLAQSEVPYYSLELALAANDRYLYVGTVENGGGVHCFEVLSDDPDDAGPTRWSDCSLGEASWDYQYFGDALPDEANGWTVVEGTAGLAEAEQGVLRIVDDSSASGSKIKWARNWDATNSRGTTVLVRARCDSYSAGGAPLAYLGNVFVRDGKYAEEFSILSDRVRACRANREYALDGTAWHTYRITTRGTGFAVYVDEAPDAVLTGPLLADWRQDPDAARARVMIGSGSTAGRQDISFDYFYNCTRGAIPPPPVLRGMEPTISVRVADAAGKGSLSGIRPSSAQVQWSNDAGATWRSSGGSLWQCSYDADALPTQASPAWSVAEGTDAIAAVNGGVLQIQDTSTAPGSKIKWQRSWNALPGEGTTVLVRARCTAAGGDLTLAGNVFVEDGLHRESFQILPNRVAAVESRLNAAIDGTQWHLYRCTTQGPRFNVYVDENPVPILSGLFTTPSSGNRVMFGSGASAGTQEIQFDYVRYCARIALPPGMGEGNGEVVVTCTPATSILPADRGEITARRIPFHRLSRTANRVQFLLQDNAGNLGRSPVYTVRIGEVPDFDHDADVDQSDFGYLQVCLAADPVPASHRCIAADLDGNGYCDASDVHYFADCMGGPDQPPRCE